MSLTVHNIHIVLYSSGQNNGYCCITEPSHLNRVNISVYCSRGKTQILFKSLGCKQIIRVVRERLRAVCCQITAKTTQSTDTHVSFDLFASQMHGNVSLYWYEFMFKLDNWDKTVVVLYIMHARTISVGGWRAFMKLKHAN